jgi:hypothetical protein
MADSSQFKEWSEASNQNIPRLHITTTERVPAREISAGKQCPLDNTPYRSREICILSIRGFVWDAGLGFSMNKINPA